MSTHETPLLWPSYEAHLRKGRRLRAEAATSSLRSAAQALAGWWRALDGATARLIDDLAARRDRRRAVEALRGLDDHILRDIGITRGEIESAVRHGREQRHLNVVMMPRRTARPATPDLRQAA